MSPTLARLLRLQKVIRKHTKDAANIGPNKTSKNTVEKEPSMHAGSTNNVHQLANKHACAMLECDGRTSADGVQGRLKLWLDALLTYPLGQKEWSVQASDSTRSVTQNASPASAWSRSSRPPLKGVGAADCGKIGDVPTELQQRRSCKGHE